MSAPPPPPVSGGRPLVRAQLGPIPLHIDLSFVLFVGLLGYSSARSDWGYLLTFVVVATVAVTLHELGHAVTVLLRGGRPSVSLAGFGGVTSWVPPRQMKRWELLAISVAGPAVGLVLWPLIVGLDHWLAPSPGTRLDDVLRLAQFTTLGWSLLNLLPVLPMDGGQILRELLPGDPPTRARRAAMASVGTGAALGLLAWRWDETFLVIFFTIFVALNVLSLRGSTSPQGRRAPVAAAELAVPEVDGSPAPTDAPVGQQLVTALWQGRRQLAREIVVNADPPLDDPVAHGAVLAVSDDLTEQQQGLALLHEQLTERPGEGMVSGLATLVLTIRHDWQRLAGLLDADPGHPDAVRVGGNVAVRALQEAWRAGDLAAVGQLAGAALYRWPTRPGAEAIAYLAALASIARAQPVAGGAGQGAVVEGVAAAQVPPANAAVDPAVHAAVVQAWTAMSGVLGAQPFALAACQGGPLPAPAGMGDVDLRAVQPPLESVPAFTSARAALAAVLAEVAPVPGALGAPQDGQAPPGPAA